MSQTAGPPMNQTAPMVTPGKGCAAWFVRDGRLRSGWRLLLYLIASFIVIILGQILLQVGVGVIYGTILVDQGLSRAAAGALIRNMFVNFFDYPGLALGIEGLRLVSGLGLIWLFRRWIDKRSFGSLGFQLVNGWWKEFAAGFWLMIGLWAIIFAVSMVTGGVQIVSFIWDARDIWTILGALGLGVAFNVMVGLIEETDARGYILQNLAEGIRFWPAVLVSSLYFGLLHLLNPGAGVTSTLGIFFAGVLLALGYYATGRLWFSIGLHAGWNFAEGPIFGFLVSGLNMGGLFRLRIIGPDWLMGGAFGPEAGALAVVVEAFMILVLLVWVRAKQDKPRLKAGTE